MRKTEGSTLMASRIRHHAMNKKQRTLFACPRTPPQQEQEEKEKQTASISSQTNPQQRPYRVLSLGILSRECWAFTGVYRMVLEHGFQLYPVYNVGKSDHSSRGQNEAVYRRSIRNPVLGYLRARTEYLQSITQPLVKRHKRLSG